MSKRAVAAALALGLLPLSQAARAARAPERVLVPIGGGYDEMGIFSRAAAQGARGPSIDLLVLPPAYAEDKATAVENGDYDLALEHTADLKTACDAVVDLARFPGGCRAELVDLFTAGDASAPAVVGRLADTAVDGYFFLGGDQGAAMQVVAGTPAEAALAAAYDRGAVVGGTSAGDAVESYVMNNGYTDQGDYNTALQLGSLDLWWGDPQLHRGLSFGDRRAIFDQHLYERGRFPRLLNETAQSVDRLAGEGLLGIGADYDTGYLVRSGARVTDLFGAASAAVVDFGTLRTRFSWVDASGRPVPSPSAAATPTAALAATGILTHLLAGRADDLGGAVQYDLATRVPSLAGAPVSPPPARAGALSATLRSQRPVLLGGDHTVDPEWPAAEPALAELARRAGRSGPIVVVAAAYSNAANARADLDAYAAALALSGWAGAVQTIAYPTRDLAGQLQGAAAVLFLSDDQTKVPSLAADPRFADAVRAARASSPVTMFERAATALAGDYVDAVDDASDPSEAFLIGAANVMPGLGLVEGAGPVAFEPRLQYDYRYGRLYGLPYAVDAASRRRVAVFGISEQTALLVGPDGVSVIGQNPVIAVDPSRAKFYAGENGAVGALNVLVDVYEPGQRFGSAGPRRAAGGVRARDRSDCPRRLQR